MRKLFCGNVGRDLEDRTNDAEAMDAMLLAGVRRGGRLQLDARFDAPGPAIAGRSTSSYLCYPCDPWSVSYSVWLELFL